MICSITHSRISIQRGNLALPDAVAASIAKLKAAGQSFNAKGTRDWLENHPLLQKHTAPPPLPASPELTPVPAVKALGFGPAKIDALRSAAQEFMQSLRGRSFLNADTRTPILVDKRGAEKAVSFLRHPNQLHALSALPEMLQRARYHDWAPDDGTHPGVLLWHYYKVPMEIAGKVRTATLAVRQLLDGHRFYDSYTYDGNEGGPAGVEDTKGGQTSSKEASTPPKVAGPPQSTAKSGNVNGTPTPHLTSIPQQPTPPQDYNLTWPDAVQEFSAWPERQTAADGSDIFLKSPKNGAWANADNI